MRSSQTYFSIPPTSCLIVYDMRTIKRKRPVVQKQIWRVVYHALIASEEIGSDKSLYRSGVRDAKAK